MVMAARIVPAVGTGIITSVASSTAAAMAPPGRRGWALAFVPGGLTLATALGLPLGTLIGRTGWHITLWAVAGIGLLAVVGSAIGLPGVTLPTASLPDRPRPLKQGRALAPTLVWAAVWGATVGVTALTLLWHLGTARRPAAPAPWHPCPPWTVRRSPRREPSRPTASSGPTCGRGNSSWASGARQPVVTTRRRRFSMSGNTAGRRVSYAPGVREYVQEAPAAQQPAPAAADAVRAYARPRPERTPTDSRPLRRTAVTNGLPDPEHCTPRGDCARPRVDNRRPRPTPPA
ncbi:hypothetical protein GCM10009647_003060 [Streptomyces sanglieri]